MTGQAKDPIFQLADTVRETSFSLHNYLRHGHLEKVYENGLANRLRKQGLDVELQQPITVLDEDDTTLGEYRADLIVEGQLLIELKAAGNLDSSHIAQVLGYLAATNFDHALLINFGAPKLQIKKLASHRLTQV
jgi:GxxExxY protein